MPITSTNPGGAVPPDYRKQRLTLSALAIGEVIRGRFTAAGSPGTDFEYTIASTNVTTATAALENAIDAKAAAGSGTAWAEVSVTNGTTYLDVFSLDADGELLFESLGVPSVVTKLWIGDAPAVAQVVSVVPLNVQIGDSFGLTINGKSITVIATAATAANVVSLFVAAIGATTIPEWLEVTAEATTDGGTLTLTANTPGVPFTVTAGSSDTLRVDIRTTLAGVAGSNAVQKISVPKSAAGTFVIIFGDQRTSGLSIGATASAVQTALQGLSTIGSGNCDVTLSTSPDGNDDWYNVTFNGTLANTPVADFIIELTSTRPVIRTLTQGATTGTIRDEVQTIDCGTVATSSTFTLTMDGQTTTAVSANVTADQMAAALSALSNVGDTFFQGVSVTKSGNVFTITFADVEGSANQTQLTASNYGSSATSGHLCEVTHVQATAAVNEVQRVAIEGTATGGTFTLTYSGQTTAGIAWNASTSAVTSALEALSNIGTGDVTVSGSPGAWLVEFTGALAGNDRPLMTATSSLTGSTANNLTVSTTTANSGPNDFDTASNWSPVGVPADGDALRFELGSSDCLYSLNQSAKTFPTVVVDMRWNARLGLPRLNAGGYLEYRTRELTAAVTSLVIGVGTGSGPQKVAVNTGSAATAIRVRDSGASSEINVPCVIWRGSNVANTIEVNGGEFGAAWYSDETAQISRLDQTGGNVFLKNTTIVDAVDVQAGTFRSYNSTLGGKPLTV
jgi:hypothetical protein